LNTSSSSFTVQGVLSTTTSFSYTALFPDSSIPIICMNFFPSSEIVIESLKFKSLSTSISYSLPSIITITEPCSANVPSIGIFPCFTYVGISLTNMRGGDLSTSTIRSNFFILLFSSSNTIINLLYPLIPSTTCSYNDTVAENVPSSLVVCCVVPVS